MIQPLNFRGFGSIARALQAALVCFAVLGVLALPAAAKDKEGKKNEKEASQAGDKVDPLSADEVLDGARVWPVHLTLTPEAWKAMEPAGGGRMGFGGLRGAGGFGPAMFLTPAFLKHGDVDADSKLSEKEFDALAAKWFAAWDAQQSGKLTTDQLRDGLNGIMEMPDFGPPRGGAGGGGGRGPGMNLQGAEGKRNGLASAAGVEFNYVHAQLTFDDREFSDVAVRFKGNGTWMQSQNSLKHSMKVDLNEFVKGQKLAGLTTLNLHNNITDASWMNEALSYRLFRDAGVPAPRTAYARVHLTVPGTHDHKYLGLYSLVEDVGKNFLEKNFGTKKGAIFKPVTPTLFAHLGEEWAKYKQSYDAKTDLTDEQTQRVIDFSRLVTQANDEEFTAKLGEYLDLEEFSGFMAVTVWLSSMDSILGPGQNYYVHLHPKTQKFQFIPWDLDHSFGQFGLIGTQEQRENLSLHHPWQGENRFLDRVFKVEAFKKPYLAQFERLNKELLRPERFHQQVDQLAAILRPAVKEESEAKLSRFEKSVAGEAVEPAGFGGDAPEEGPGAGRPAGGFGGGGGGGFMQRSKPIKGFVSARAPAVAEQLAGKSEGERVGGFGMGGRGGRGGGPGGPGPGRGRGRGGFGPGNFLNPAFMSALDSDKNSEISKSEFTEGFSKWFKKWNSDNSGTLTDEQLRAGINADLAPARFGAP